MLSKIIMELDTNGFDYQKASILQSVMFAQIDKEYAEKMHNQNMHPYSQSIICEGKRVYWVVNTLDKEAYEKIIIPLSAEEFNEFTIKHREEQKIIIKGKEVIVKEKSELFTNFKESKPDSEISIKFNTPTAFKKNGVYVIVPDLRLLYQNLMMKYTESSDNVNMIDEDMLDTLVEASFISGFNAHSTVFYIKGARIPGFLGNITIRFRGNESVAKYIRLLLEFGQYSGVGIKSGMGMGAIRIGENKNVRR